MNAAGLLSGLASVGLAIGAIQAKHPYVVAAFEGLSGLAGYASTFFATLGVITDCIAHNLDSICQISIAGAAAANLIGVLGSIGGGPIAGTLAGGIFGTITSGSLLLTGLPGAAKRPEIDW